MPLALRAFSAVAVLALAGCGGAPLPACPDAGTALTYQNFGIGFMAGYCIECHGSGRTEKGLILTTPGAVRGHAEAVNAESGTGSAMPPRGSPLPSAAERAQLVEWLSCGAP
ncbi:MAG: hypothetical protein H6Q89_2657 [Myxococcaceae bacterium]|nr:hypothetical protein [Myxococcaceae bacterium]